MSESRAEEAKMQMQDAGKTIVDSTWAAGEAVVHVAGNIASAAVNLAGAAGETVGLVSPKPPPTFEEKVAIGKHPTPYAEVVKKASQDEQESGSSDKKESAASDKKE